MKRPRDGDRVQGIPYNDDGRYADYADVFPPEDPSGPIEGRLVQKLKDTAFGPRLSSYIVMDSGAVRLVEGDRIVVLKSNTTVQDRTAGLREQKKSLIDLADSIDIKQWLTEEDQQFLSDDEMKALGYVDTDPDPSPNPGATKLRNYWTKGPGAAKIKWGVSGDFNRCVKHLRKHVGSGAEGLCNVYHRSATGSPPGKGPHAG